MERSLSGLGPRGRHMESPRTWPMGWRTVSANLETHVQEKNAYCYMLARDFFFWSFVMQQKQTKYKDQKEKCTSGSESS